MSQQFNLKITMGNNEKEQVNPDVLADDSDQELTNNIDGTKTIPESEMMSDDGADNLEIGNMKDIEQANIEVEDTSRTQMKSNFPDSDLPHDVPNDETPLMSEMPKNYEKISKKEANVLSKDEQ